MILMYDFVPQLKNGYTKMFGPIARFLYRRLHLGPTAISIISLCFGIAGALALLGNNHILVAVFLLASLIFDALDGSVARIYNLVSVNGYYLDLLIDRVIETFLFLALAYVGLVSYKTVLLLLCAIFLMTLLKRRTGIDFGFKRTGFFLGYLIGFPLALTIAFWINLGCFIVQLAVLDYRKMNRVRE